MIIVLNRTNNGFVERLPGGTPGRYPFHVGDKTVSPAAGGFVFVDPEERGIINTLLAEQGLRIGRLMGGHEYLIVETMIDWEMERTIHRLSHDELVEQLEFEYYAILAANPNWTASLEEFLQERGVECGMGSMY